MEALASYTPENGSVGHPSAGTCKGANIFARIHRHMYGRYHWAVLAGLLAASVGMVVGYRSSVPTYRSNGTLRITPLTLRILYAQSGDVAPSIFDGFVDVQVNIMRSKPVVESVLRNPEWLEARGQQPPIEPEIFLRNLEITHPVRSEVINITYTDTSPEAAMTGVRLLIAAYLSIYGDRSGNQRMTALEERTTMLTKKLEELKLKMGEIAQEHGTDDLKELHQTKVQELNRLEGMLKDTEINLILAEAALGNSDDFKKMPVGEIAAVDELMRKLLEEKHQYEIQAADLRLRYGEDYSDLVRIKTLMRAVDRKVEDRAEAFRNFRRSSFVNNVGVLEGVPTPAAVDALKQRSRKLHELYDASLERSLDIGRKSLLVNNLQEEARLTKERLAETQSKLDQLKVDSSVIGQINIINEGDRPLVPAKDKRYTLALGVAAGGFVLGFGAVVALTFTDRRLRRVADLACVGTGVPLLGFLPRLSGRDPDEQPLAAHCVQSIVAAMQTDPQIQAARVLAVTSPATAEGKTELTLALGYAFAMLGLRTLLIDFDTAKGVLSSRLLAVGSEMVRDQTGSSDMLDGFPLGKCLVEPGVAGLQFLSIGNLGPTRRADLTPASIRRLLSEAGERFDMVLIDAGTIGHALKAALICREAESTLLVVKPGTLDTELNESLERLRHAEACVGGVVFNQALDTDVKRLKKKYSFASTQATTGQSPHNLALGQLANPVGLFVPGR